ncbi:MAG: hypothetical protein RQ743_00300 [Bacteroidales bacterium]|nr:hypothetical protein [Bacteroidales bacterium]
MDNLSVYESRIGKIKSGAKEIFSFVADMRNLSRFLPDHSIENWKASKDECSFEVSLVGEARIRIVQKDPYDTVKYTGYGLNNTQFNLWIQMKEVKEKDTRIKLTIKTDLNPGLKMIASKPINDFLNKLVSGMEEFNDWDNTEE